MPLTHHPLVQEFPKLKAQIHTLKTGNNFFHHLMERYELIDKKIYRIESGEEPTSDEYVDRLGKERLQLKDELYKIILKNK
ncbi:MAG: GTP-binding protein [Methylophaga sp.]|nr:MAG: GTP-binding protein [Methylophaga sp.]